MLPIRHVDISTDAQYIPIQKLKSIVKDNVHGGFFSLKTAQLENALAQLPWVESSAIQRDWPDKLKVIINERQPLARWGSKGVVDKSGQLFFPAVASIPQTLPTIYGPIERLADVVGLYQQLASLTQSVSLNLAVLSLDDRGSWQLVLSKGTQVILGREDMLQRYKRFVSLYPRIIAKSSRKALTVDLRYPNGLAVKWQK